MNVARWSQDTVLLQVCCKDAKAKEHCILGIGWTGIHSYVPGMHQLNVRFV